MKSIQEASCSLNKIMDWFEMPASRLSQQLHFWRNVLLQNKCETEKLTRRKPVNLAKPKRNLGKTLSGAQHLEVCLGTAYSFLPFCLRKLELFMSCVEPREGLATPLTAQAELRLCQDQQTFHNQQSHQCCMWNMCAPVNWNKFGVVNSIWNQTMHHKLT